MESLPAEAAARLDDPNLFQLLVRDDSESLYRVLPAFLALDTPPASSSYEALRQAVPPSKTVYLPAPFGSGDVLRVASALSHARLLGAIDPAALNLRTPWQAEPLGDHVPDLVVALAKFAPWTFPTALRQPIWSNGETAVYALDGAIAPIISPSPRVEPFPFSVTLSDVRPADSGGIAFTATFDDRAPDLWSGQDWVMIAIEVPPWDIPTQLHPQGHTPATHIWFSGQLWPGAETTSLAYEFDFRTPGLAFRDSGGVLTPAQASETESGPGLYTLGVRLRHQYKPDQWRIVAYIPVLRIIISETGEFSYEVYESARGGAIPAE